VRAIGRKRGKGLVRLQLHIHFSEKFHSWQQSVEADYDKIVTENGISGRAMLPKCILDKVLS
jgi:hypothetical protein